MRKIIISLIIGGAVFVAADHFTWLISHDEQLASIVGIITGIIAVYISLNNLPLPNPNFTDSIKKARSIKDKFASKLAESDAKKPDQKSNRKT